MDLINIPFIIAVLSVLGLVTFLIYQKLKTKREYDEIVVSYSDKVGDTIIEHDKQYIGLIHYQKDELKIPGLRLIRPVPPRHVFISTNSGKKKLYLVRIDSDRYGFRIPSLHNQVLIEKRDAFGEIIKNKNGQPVIIKHKWEFCDDIIESDVVHWAENMKDKIREKHKTKMDMLGKWVGAAVVGMILLAGIITIQMTVKFAGQTFKDMETLSSNTAEQVEENAGLVNSLIARIDKQQQSTSPPPLAEKTT